MVDETFDVLPDKVEDLRNDFVARDDGAIDWRVLLIELLARQMQLLLMIFLRSIIEVLLVEFEAARVVFHWRKFVIVIVTTIIVIAGERRVE